VQVVLPSSPVRDGAERQAFEAGMGWLNRHGVEVLPPVEVGPGAPPWLAGSDEQRASALRQAFCADVDIVWMGRGGTGAARTLAAWAGLQRAGEAPTARLWGFSDGTTLIAEWARRGWPAWSAPPLTQLGRLDEASQERVLHALAGRVPAFAGLTTMVPGRAEGPLAGGNLTVLASLVGTPQMPSLAGSIVVLEEVGEAAYRVDRMLHQLLFAGAFEGVIGVALGDFSGVSEEESQRVAWALDDFFGRLGLPCAKGLPVGHGTRNAPLPMGCAKAWTALLRAGAEATLMLTNEAG